MKSLALAAALFAAALLPAQAQTADDPANTLVMETPHGEVVIALRPDIAPAHAERLVTLTREGFYDGAPFHRVIPGFMAQTGDPTGTGMGSSELPDLQAEFSSEPFTRGSVGMARAQNPNSANSQFFIVYDRADWLDNEYTLIGEVVSGMDAIDQIAPGAGQSGMVDDPDRIESMRVLADTQ
ncbi:peptidylprolyl isomerase [Saliniramus sp.]|uniref:peptidylprolyl isomerase n=1 Tax=Saliniramus sp. TaxID=2986772 RepID=UPI002B5D65AD|nr:peptidylprolyl isomerase [Saliniramus sp.]HMB10440.1 peptidylprolyl isomerase [Saliniramus sp.]